MKSLLFDDSTILRTSSMSHSDCSDCNCDCSGDSDCGNCDCDCSNCDCSNCDI